MFGIGMPELVVIMVVALVVLGPKRLPEVARTLGKAMAEFRRQTSDIMEEFQAHTLLDDDKPGRKTAAKPPPDADAAAEAAPTAAASPAAATAAAASPAAATAAAASPAAPEPATDKPATGRA